MRRITLAQHLIMRQRDKALIDAELRLLIETVARACKAHGKVLGMGGIRGDLELQRDLVRLGARFIIAGSDVSYLSAAARKDVEVLRGIGKA